MGGGRSAIWQNKHSGLEKDREVMELDSDMDVRMMSIRPFQSVVCASFVTRHILGIVRYLPRYHASPYASGPTIETGSEPRRGVPTEGGMKLASWEAWKGPRMALDDAVCLVAHPVRQGPGRCDGATPSLLIDDPGESWNRVIGGPLS
jgi:hypothetical protein